MALTQPKPYFQVGGAVVYSASQVVTSRFGGCVGAYCTRAVDMAGGRYLTLLIFLNDLGVGAGGNTTFPLAGAVEQPPSPADVKVGIQPRIWSKISKLTKPTKAIYKLYTSYIQNKTPPRKTPIPKPKLKYSDACGSYATGR